MLSRDSVMSHDLVGQVTMLDRVSGEDQINFFQSLAGSLSLGQS